MNTNHTPGPWHANGTMIVGKLGKRNQYVADALRDVGVETCKANARLIASAPELLAALQAIVQLTETYSSTGLSFAVINTTAREAIARTTA